MRLPLAMALLGLALNIAIDFYIWRRLHRHPRARKLHIAASVVLSLLWAGIICVPKRVGDDAFLVRIMWAIYAYWSVYLPKYIAVIFDAAGALPHLWHRRRWHVLTIAGVALGVVSFGAMWWGALVERFRLDVREVEIDIPTLPQSFRGMRIVQISDWHVGSYADDTIFVAKTVDAINALHPDIILFTGDIVNRHSNELRPFTSPLSRLCAPLGVYSVMGNHDYGDYYNWTSEAAHKADADTLRALQRRMGWHMLDNSTAMLHRASDSIALIGVENIGEPPFTTRGDLRRAYPHTDDEVTKILLSHNPRHWTDSIAGNNGAHIALTLSGHTHAMQMKIGSFSPASWKYPTWGGLYTDSLGRHLYVNIGLGTVGLPMRIGATPEITLITLR